MPIVCRPLAQRKTILLPLVFFGLILMVAGCSQASDDVKPTGGTLVVGLLSEPASLNPLVATSAEASDIINMMFLKLLDQEADFLTFSPRLATRWTFSDDSLSITFDLREDVRWEDGVRFTADDVRYTWQLQTDTLVAWGSRRLKDRIRDVEVIDAHTVRFVFTNRYPYQLTDANDGVILPKHIMEKIPREEFRTAAFGRHPIGNGPLKFVGWPSGQYVDLERNPLYYEKGKPYLDRVIFRIVPDMTTLVTQLKAGEIDCLESIPVDALDEVQKKYPDIAIHRYLSRGFNFISWNTRREPLIDRDVRRAFAMAIDTGEIISTLWGGMAEPFVGPMHPMLWAHDKELRAIGYSPDDAARILRSRGWTDSDGDGVLDKRGRKLEIEMITNRGVQLRADVITMVQGYLQRIGVKVNARVFEFNTFIQQVTSGEYDSCVLGWKTTARADLTGFWHSSSTPPDNGTNISGYSNETVDDLIDRAKNTLDPDEARLLWYRCQRIIYEDQPFFFLAVPYEVVGLRKRFCGVEPSPVGFFLGIADWYVSEDCQE